MPRTGRHHHAPHARTPASRPGGTSQSRPAVGNAMLEHPQSPPSRLARVGRHDQHRAVPANLRPVELLITPGDRGSIAATNRVFPVVGFPDTTVVFACRNPSINASGSVSAFAARTSHGSNGAGGQTTVNAGPCPGRSLARLPRPTPQRASSVGTRGRRSASWLVGSASPFDNLQLSTQFPLYSSQPEHAKERTSTENSSPHVIPGPRSWGGIARGFQERSLRSVRDRREPAGRHPEVYPTMIGTFTRVSFW
jgi:hypothetical protein